MILKFFKNEKFPGTVDTLKLCAVKARTSSHEHYPSANPYYGDCVQYIDMLLDGGQTITIDDHDSVVINGVTVNNDSEENAIKILEFLNGLMWLEHDDTKTKPKTCSLDDFKK